MVVRLRGSTPLKRGDGVVFDCGRPDEAEAGGRVFEVFDARGDSVARNAAEAVTAGEYELTFAAGLASSWGRGSGGYSQNNNRNQNQTQNASGNARQPAPGDLVWRSSDPELESRLRKMIPEGIEGETPRRRDAVTVRVSSAGLGAPLHILVVDAHGREGTAVTAAALTPAANQPMSFASLAKAVGQLGGTPFEVGELNVDGLDLSENLFIAAGEIKSARRAAVEALVQVRRTTVSGVAQGLAVDSALPAMLGAAWWGDDADADVSKRQAPTEVGQGTKGRQRTTTSAASAAAAAIRDDEGEPRLTVLCRTREQAEAALTIPWLTEVVLDFLEVHGLQDAVRAVQASGRAAVVATPRVLKPNEEKLWRFYLKLGADALLVRSAGLMQTLQRLRPISTQGDGQGGISLANGRQLSTSRPISNTGGGETEMGGVLTKTRAAPTTSMLVPPLRGDFSLNAANAVAASTLLQAGRGLDRLTPTHDLNAGQQAALARALGPKGAAALEVVIHQHLPIFHTEHCVFARFLSDGDSYKDCGHPCETQNVHLRDGDGKDHLVLADMGCRNTVFNATAQSGAEYVDQLTAAGVQHFRVELVDEPAGVVAPLMEGYRRVLAGEMRGSELVAWVGTLPDANGRSHGAGPGSLEVRQERDRGSMKQTAAAKNAAARTAARGR